MTRMDWAVDLFAWFEYWLKGNGVMPEMHVQMQRNDENGTLKILLRLKIWNGK